MQASLRSFSLVLWVLAVVLVGEAKTSGVPGASAGTGPYDIDRIVMATPDIGWATAERLRDPSKPIDFMSDLIEPGTGNSAVTVVLRTVDGCRHWKEVCPTGLPALSKNCSTHAVGLHVFDGLHAITLVRAPVDHTLSMAETADGGKTWKSKTVVGPSGYAGLFVSFGDGGYGAILACSGGMMGKMEKWLYVTKDGGATWNMTATTDTPVKNLGTLDLFCFADELKVFGREIWLRTSSHDPGIVWTSSNDNGKRWKSKSYARLPSGWYVGGAPLPSFKNTDVKRATTWIAGNRRTMNEDQVRIFTVTTKDGGKSFSTAPTPGVPSSGWKGVFVDDRRGFLIDHHGAEVFVTGDAGKTVQHIALNPPLWKWPDVPGLAYISDTNGSAYLRASYVSTSNIYHLNGHGQPELIYAGGYVSGMSNEDIERILQVARAKLEAARAKQLGGTPPSTK